MSKIYFQALDEVIRSSLDLSDELKFDKTHGYHFHLVSLYGSMIELCFTIKELEKCDSRIAIPIIFRTVLEAELDLKNLIEEPKYGYRLELGFIRSWLEYLGVARRGENQFLKGLTQHPNLSDSIKQQKAREKELLKKGVQRIDIKEKFKLAEMEEEYGAVYPGLCSHTHNGLQALRERHGKISGKSYEMTYFKSMNSDEFSECALLAGDILIRAMESINKVFKCWNAKKLADVRLRFNQKVENV